MTPMTIQNRVFQVPFLVFNAVVPLYMAGLWEQDTDTGNCRKYIAHHGPTRRILRLLKAAFLNSVSQTVGQSRQQQRCRRPRRLRRRRSEAFSPAWLQLRRRLHPRRCGGQIRTP